MTNVLALGSAHAASGANWTDYADLVFEVGILLTAIVALIVLVRMLRAQRAYISRVVESIESEIAEHRSATRRGVEHADSVSVRALLGDQAR